MMRNSTEGENSVEVVNNTLGDEPIVEEYQPDEDSGFPTTGVYNEQQSSSFQRENRVNKMSIISSTNEILEENEESQLEGLDQMQEQ